MCHKPIRYLLFCKLLCVLYANGNDSAKCKQCEQCGHELGVECAHMGAPGSCAKCGTLFGMGLDQFPGCPTDLCAPRSGQAGKTNRVRLLGGGWGVDYPPDIF